MLSTTNHGMTTTGGDIVFTGGSAEEAEDFIFAVKKHASANGKQNDNEWIASFVSLCFAKKALRWYERLDEEIQNDWKLLKRAILDEYEHAAVSPRLLPYSVPGSVGPIAPAAPPPLSIGRIRVDSSDSNCCGYVSKTFVVDDRWCCIATKDNAAMFEYDRGRGEIKFKDLDDTYLAVRPYVKDWNLQEGSTDGSVLTRNKGKNIPAHPTWANEMKFDCWSIGDATRLLFRWSTSTGDPVTLQGATYSSDRRIYLVPDQRTFTRTLGSYYKDVTLYFEPNSPAS